MARVMVVGYREESCRRLEALLKEHGYEVLTATNGREALETIKLKKPDLIIADILMPVMDGFQLCRMIKSDPTLRDIPLVFYTATYTDARDEAMAFKSGADRFIRKPEGPEALINAVRNVIAEAKKGELRGEPPALPEEPVHLKLYNERLVRELEDKLAELREARRRLRALQRMSALMTAPLNPEEVLQAIVRGFTEELDYPLVMIALVDEERKALVGEHFATPASLRKALALKADEFLTPFSIPLEAKENHAVRAVMTGEPVVVDGLHELMEGVLSAEQVEELQRLRDIRAVALVPMRVRKEAVGLLAVATAREDFAPDELETLHTFANQAAVALWNARLYEKTQRYGQEMAVLCRTMLDLSAQLDLSQLLQVIVERAALLLGGNGGGILIYDRPTGELELVTTWGIIRPEFAGLRLRVGEGLAGRILQSGKPMAVHDYASWEGRLKRFQKCRFTAVAGAPLKWGESILGVITVVDDRRGRVFTDQDLKLLELFANQAAIAVVNARLFTQLEQSEREATALFEIAQALSQTLELPELLKLIYEQVRRVTDATVFHLVLYDETTGTFRCPIIVCREEYYPPRTLSEPPGGFVGYVFRTRQPILVRDLQEEREKLKQLGIDGFLFSDLIQEPRSVLAVPLLIENRLVGILSVQSPQAYAYDSDDIRLLSTIAGQAAVALENARLFTELRASEEKYRLLVQEALAGVYIIQDNVLKFVNPRLAQIFGYEVDELVDKKSPLELTVPEDRALVAENIRRRIEGEVPWMRYRFRGLRKDGSVFHAEVLGVRIEYEGRPAVQGMLLDVTDQVEMRQKLEAIYELGQELMLCRDVEEIARAVTDIASRFLKFEIWGFMLVDEERNELYTLVHSSREGELEPISLPLDGDKGVTVAVVRSGESIYVPDVRKDPRYVRGSDFKALSELAVPLKIGDRVIGVLNVESSRLDAFTEADYKLLSALASQAAIALENARLFNELERRLREFSLLRDLGLVVTSELELGKVLDIVTAQAAELVEAEGCWINLLSSDGKKRIYMACYGPHADRLKDLERPVDSGLQGWVISHGEPILSNEPLSDPRTAMDIAQAISLRNILIVPLKVKGRVIGCLSVVNKKGELPFGEHDLHLLTIYAGQVATAIENARLFSQVERAKREWEETFDAILDGISIHDPDFRIVRVNQALADMLGLSPRELVGRRCYEVFHQTDRPIDGCPHARVLKTTAPASTEYNDLRQTGKIFHISASPLFDEEGRFIGSVHVMRDITEEKRLQEQLIQAEKLSALGQLIAGVAHELNNPLTAVVGFAQLLQAADVDEKIKADLKRIYQQAQRAVKIVDNLLDFARRRPPRREFVNVNEVIEQALAFRAYELRVHNIRVLTDLAPRLPWTLADFHQLQQVFLNIIINAEQAMSEAHGKGTLTVRSGVRVRKTGEQVIRVEFQDDGPGIPPDILPRIFDPFFTTKIGKGTGLGLSIAYGIISEHGGRIWAESELGKGATFIVELPVAEIFKPQARPEGERAHEEGISAQRILVVEDEKAVAELLTEMLAQDGHEVEMASNGEEALRKLSQQPFDLVISDLKMPGMSGQEFYRHLQDSNPSLAQRVIFITGDVINPETQDFLSRCKCPYLTKPFWHEQLRAAMKTALRQSAA